MADRDLEHLCTDWIAWHPPAEGFQRLEAWFSGTGFAKHRHDTYAVGLTVAGVQSFWYRGSVHASTPGEVVVLHPDEVHDGYAGSHSGFGYRILYVDPERIAEAARVITGRQTSPLPFVRNPVVKNRRLRELIVGAFSSALEPLNAANMAVSLTEALLEEAGAPATTAVRIDRRAVERARQLLDGVTSRPVHSPELEAASGLSRFELARQFRLHIGTTPYRYSLMRRLDRARLRLGTAPMVTVALECGFSDQAHFSRAFKAAYGLTPRRYVALRHGSH